MTSDAMPYIPPFRVTPNEYSLHNAAPETFDLQWGGLRFTIPAVDVVGTKAAAYDTGEKIPGTCVLKDAGAPGREGIVESKNWRAEDAIRNVLGIDLETGKATGVAARHGISFLPDKPTRQLVAEVREHGERRWHDSQVEWAEREVASYQGAIEKSKEAGVIPPRPGKDYRKALTILDRYHKEIDKVFGRAAEETVEAVTHDDEIEMEVYLKAAALQMAGKVAAEKEVDKNVLADEMLQDPKIRKHLQKKFSIRKKGHTEAGSFPVPPQTIELPDVQDAGEPPGEG